jgi:flagellar biosynthesis GTPase FlhF
MLTELNGASPVLLALTGESYDTETLGRSKKKKGGFFKKLWNVTPLMLTVRAAKFAAKESARKIHDIQRRNAQKLALEKANMARKVAEARKAQAETEKAERAAETENAKAQAQEQAAQAQEAPPESMEEQAPEETSAEEIPESSEEGAEQSAEVMGYARTNDDYFVGNEGLKKALRRYRHLRRNYHVPGLLGAATTTSQLKVVSKPVNKTPLYVIGGAAVAAFVFRKQLKKVLK